MASIRSGHMASGKGIVNLRTHELQLYPTQPGPGGITIRDLCVQGYSCFISPAPGNITNGVATSSQHQHRQVKALHKFHTLGMPFGGRRWCWVKEAPKTLPTQPYATWSHLWWSDWSNLTDPQIGSQSHTVRRLHWAGTSPLLWIWPKRIYPGHCQPQEKLWEVWGWRQWVQHFLLYLITHSPTC